MRVRMMILIAQSLTHTLATILLSGLNHDVSRVRWFTQKALPSAVNFGSHSPNPACFDPFMRMFTCFMVLLPAGGGEQIVQIAYRALKFFPCEIYHRLLESESTTNAAQCSARAETIILREHSTALKELLVAMDG